MREGKCYFFDVFKRECSVLIEKATPEQCERCKFFKTAEEFEAGRLAAAVSIGPIKVGCLYWISDEEKKMIEKFEKERNIKVYHLILSHTNIGEMYSLLYVSQYPEEWDMDKESLKMGQPCVCAFIKDDDYNVDFGSIVISSGSGGLIRTY